MPLALAPRRNSSTYCILLSSTYCPFTCSTQPHLRSIRNVLDLVSVKRGQYQSGRLKPGPMCIAMPRLKPGSTMNAARHSSGDANVTTESRASIALSNVQRRRHRAIETKRAIELNASRTAEQAFVKYRI